MTFVPENLFHTPVRVISNAGTVHFFPQNQARKIAVGCVFEEYDKKTIQYVVEHDKNLSLWFESLIVVVIKGDHVAK